MTRSRILYLLISFCVAVILSIYASFQYALKEALPFDGLNQIEIKKGQSLSRVLGQLELDGYMTPYQAFVAKLYARHNDLQGAIKVGEFPVKNPVSIPEFLALITSNSQIQYRLTFVEGSRLKDIILQLKSDTRLEHKLKDYTEASIREQVSIDPRFKGAKLEGLFSPDTYQFEKSHTDVSILQRAHNQLVRILDEEWAKRDKNIPVKSPYEALILASIVEKETGHPDERPEISGVFSRRLNKGMRLQTDPTVIYGLGDRYKGNITRAHLREKTAYNTYRINGLPPSPIALVGRAAIHAALHPKDGKTLYFVAKGDGTHYFSETIDEHNNAVRKYQLKRRKDYRSTHTATN